MRAAAIAGAIRACVVAGVLACSLGGLIAFSQDPGPRPVLVTIEFRALAGGVPVSDLRPEEVSLRIDNLEPEIYAFDLVRLDGSRTAAPFATNLGRRGRDVILAVDEESFSPGAELPLRDALTALVQQLTPHDRAALISLHPSGQSLALSGARAPLHAVIARLRGRGIGPEASTDLSCRTRRLLPSLTSLIRGIDGDVATTVVLFSAALAAPGPASVPARGVESACLLLPTDFDEFRAAGTRSAAELYAVHVVESAPRAAGPGAAAGIERLAGEAGGRFVSLAGDAAGVMKTIAQETAVLYAVSALVPRSAAAARRPVDVRVRRPGVTLRVRPELVTPASETKTVSTRDMIRTANAFHALPLRAAGLPSRGSPAEAKVIVLFEPVEPAVTLTAAMVGAFNPRGQLVAEWTSGREDLGNRPIAAALMVPPGDYRLRVAAVDALGRSGAVDEEMRIETALTTSAVVLGAMTANGLAPRLQFTPRDAKATVYLELYGVRSCAAVVGRFDVASAAGASAIVSASATAIPIDQAEGCILHGEIDLAALAPGDYVVGVEIASSGSIVSRTTRTLRKAMR